MTNLQEAADETAESNAKVDTYPENADLMEKVSNSESRVDSYLDIFGVLLIVLMLYNELDRALVQMWWVVVSQY